MNPFDWYFCEIFFFFCFWTIDSKKDRYLLNLPMGNYFLLLENHYLPTKAFYEKKLNEVLYSAKFFFLSQRKKYIGS